MRLARLLPLLIPFVAAAQSAELSVVRVWTGPRTADSFQRISEYFTGEENTGGRTILRSQPAERAGYYWLIRTRTDSPQSARVELSVIPPGASGPRVWNFDTPIPSGSHVTLAGLTGSDWPAADALPVAWRLRILGPGGVELAVEQSFLWPDPAES